MSSGMFEGLKTATEGWDFKKTMGALAMGGKAYSATSGANAARASAEATRRGLEFNAAVERNNATMREYQAQDAIARGQKMENAQRLRTAQLFGRQRASLAGRGLSLAEGSPLAILTDTLQMGEIDALQVRDNASREAWGFRTEAGNASARAGMYGAQAGAIDPSRAFRASMIGSAGSVADSWYKTVGLPSPSEPKKKVPLAGDMWEGY